MLAQESPDHLQFPVQRLGAELAQRVAQVGLRRAVQLAHADAPGDPVGDREGACGKRFRDLVAIGALGAQIGSHSPARRLVDAIVHVEQQCADSVVELSRDPVALICEVPARLVGRGERVVGRREDHFVETTRAQRRGAVARRGRRLAAAARSRAVDEDEHDQPDDDQGQQRERRPTRAPAPRPRCPLSVHPRRSVSETAGHGVCRHTTNIAHQGPGVRAAPAAPRQRGGVRGHDVLRGDRAAAAEAGPRTAPVEAVGGRDDRQLSGRHPAGLAARRDGGGALGPEADGHGPGWRCSRARRSPSPSCTTPRRWTVRAWSRASEARSRGRAAWPGWSTRRPPSGAAR